MDGVRCAGNGKEGVSFLGGLKISEKGQIVVKTAKLWPFRPFLS